MGKTDDAILTDGTGTRMRPYSNAVDKEMSLIGLCLMQDHKDSMAVMLLGDKAVNTYEKALGWTRQG